METANKRAVEVVYPLPVGYGFWAKVQGVGTVTSASDWVLEVVTP